jgi:hypothetical protein
MAQSGHGERIVMASLAMERQQIKPVQFLFPT